MAMKLMKKAVPHTIAGIRKAPMNICLIHRLPVRRDISMGLVRYSSLFFFFLKFISKDSRIYMFDYFSHKKPKEISNNILHQYKS